MMEAANASSEALSGHVTAREPSGSVGRWRADIEPVLQDFCTVSFGSYLREFGYLAYAARRTSPLVFRSSMAVSRICNRALLIRYRLLASVWAPRCASWAWPRRCD